MALSTAGMQAFRSRSSAGVLRRCQRSAATANAARGCRAGSRHTLEAPQRISSQRCTSCRAAAAAGGAPARRLDWGVRRSNVGMQAVHQSAVLHSACAASLAVWHGYTWVQRWSQHVAECSVRSVIAHTVAHRASSLCACNGTHRLRASAARVRPRVHCVQPADTTADLWTLHGVCRSCSGCSRPLLWKLWAWPACCT